MILVYVDGLLVFGSTSAVAEISVVLLDRFPLTGGASDYLGTEFEISDSVAHVHQEAYVAKVITGGWVRWMSAGDDTTHHGLHGGELRRSRRC